MTLSEDDWADVAVSAYDRMPNARVAVVLATDDHNVGCHSFPGDALLDEETTVRLLVGFVSHIANAAGVTPLRISVGLTSVIEQLTSAGRIVSSPGPDGRMVTAVVGPNGESSAAEGGAGLGVIEGGLGASGSEDADGTLDAAREALRAAPTYRPTLRIIRPTNEGE